MSPPLLNDAVEPPRPRGLLRSSVTVALMTLVSRVLGLIRDVVLATYLGASANADAFFVAFKVPQFLRRLFAEGAFSQAFVPVLADVKAQGSRAAVQALIDRVAGVLGGSLALLTALMVLGAPLVTALFAPGFLDDPAKYALTVDLIRITFPYLLLISLTGFCGAVLNSYGRFAVPAFTPVWLNLSLIGAALWSGQYTGDPVYMLAWGVLLAGVIQLCFQIPFLYRLELLPRPRWDTRHPDVRRIMTLMLPALFGVSVGQINLLLDTVLASFLPTGSISWLYYSDRLMELPLGVFGIAIATVILPGLAAQHASADGKAFSATLDWALRCVLLIGLPAALALALLAKPILVTLFQYGALSPHDVRMATLSLQAYSLGLVAFMLVKVLAPGFYARSDMMTPVRIGIVAMVANMVLNLAFVLPLLFWFGIGHVGLALATSVAAFINAGLLWRGLRRRDVYLPLPHWRATAGRLAGALLVMALVLWWLCPPASAWLDWGWRLRVPVLGGLILAGAASYFAAHYLFGSRLRDFRTAA